MRKVNFWFGVVSVAALSLGATVFAQDQEAAQGLNGNGGEVEIEEVVESVDTAPTQEEKSAEPEKNKKAKDGLLKTCKDKVGTPTVKVMAGVSGKTKRFLKSFFIDLANNKELAGIKEKIWSGGRKYLILVPALFATNVYEYRLWSKGKKDLKYKYSLDFLKFNADPREWRGKALSIALGSLILYLLSCENDGKPVEPVEAEQEVQAEPVAAEQPEAAAPVAPTPTPEAA